MVKLSRTSLLVAVALFAVTNVGCGDDGDCPSEVVVAFATPVHGATITEDEAGAPGVQVTIRARSNLPEGSGFTLTVTTADSQVAEYTGTADSNGDVTFAGITLPAGDLTLDITATGSCGTGSDTINVTVLGDGECAVVIREGPIPNDYYGVPVLNTTNDSDTAGSIPNFQANIDVSTIDGATVEVFVQDNGGAETSAGTMDATGGTASFPLTLAQGRQSIRATCVLGANFAAGSPTQTVQVDTETPVCTLNPAGGSIIPAMDTSPPVDDGIQLNVAGKADSGAAADVEGESATITINGTAQTTPDLDANGDTSVPYTFDMAATGISASFTAQDHAGNTCLVETTYNVALDPDTPGALNAVANTRQSIRMTWVAPGVGGQAVAGYIIKYAPNLITEANFDSVGFTVSTPPTPSAPGVTDTVQINGLRAGVQYFVAVAADDGAGGRGPAAIAGPIKPQFDKSGVIEPDNVSGSQLFGKSLAAGYLNNDAYPDLAVGAPDENGQNGAVYVYLGRATGYPSTHDFKITGVGSFGTAVAIMDWNEDNTDDLIVGAPWANPVTSFTADGEVRVFHGGAAFDVGGTPPAAHTDADVVIGVENDGMAGTNWFEESGLGYSLATGNFGDGGTPRLIAGAWVGGAGIGGVVVLTPNVGGANVLLSDDPSSSGANASAVLIENPGGTPSYELFGLYVTNVGPAEGSGDLDDDFAISTFCPQDLYVIRGGLTAPSAGPVASAAYNSSTDLHLTDVSTETCGGTPDPYFGFAVGSLGVPTGRLIVIGSFKDGANDFGRVVIGRGSATGTHAVDSAGFHRATITGTASTAGAGGDFFGTAIVNNATALSSPDVNNDGVEDLIIIGGTTQTRSKAYVMFGGGALSDTDNTSLSYFVAEDLFYQWELPASDTPSKAIWCGDSPNVGLEAICWADASRRRSGEYDGGLVILWDDDM